MGVHIAGFFENQDGAGTEQNLAALSDPLSQMYATSGDDLRVHGSYRYISGVYAGLDQTVAARARLVSEGLRTRYGQAFIPEINSGAEPGSPQIFNDWRMNPLELDAGEILNVQTVNNPAAAADQFVMLWMSDGRVQPMDPTGGFWVRATTAASAMTANTWNARSLTLDTNLKTGRYHVLGADGISTSAIALRLAFEGQVNKPGVLARDAQTDIRHRSFEVPGQWGVLGEFHTNNLPVAEFLVDAADNEAQELRLFVRRVG